MKKISQDEILERKLKGLTPRQWYNWFSKEYESVVEELRLQIKWFELAKKRMSLEQAKKWRRRLKYNKTRLMNAINMHTSMKKLIPKFEKEREKRKES